MKVGKKGATVVCIVIGCLLTPFVFSGIFNIIQGIVLMNKGSEDAIGLIVFGALVLIFALIIGGALISSLLFSKDKVSTMTTKERLYGKGKLMQATVGNVIAEGNYSKVFCYYEDKHLNRVYRFLSEDFNSYDAGYFREGMQIDVYVNPHDENDYYVAIEHVGVTPVK